MCRMAVRGRAIGYLAYKIGHSGPREVVAPHPHRSRNATPPNGCAITPGTTAPLPPERLHHYPRNGCAFSAGTAAPFGPEGALVPVAVTVGGDAPGDRLVVAFPQLGQEFGIEFVGAGGT